MNGLPLGLDNSALLARLLESFTEALQLVDLSGQLLWSNTEAQRLLGLPERDLPETPHCTALWDGRTEFDEAVAGRRASFEAGYTTASGKELWLALDLVPFPPFIYIICKDRTEEHHRAEDIAQLEAFVSSTADGVIGFDSQGVISFWNASAEQIFGYTTQEAIGQRYTLIASAEMWTEQDQTYVEIGHGIHRRMDTRRRRKDGTLVDVTLTVSPLFRGTQRTQGGIMLVQDITEKVKVLEELRLRKEQIETTVQQLAELNAKLQTTAEEKRQFVNMVLHDLRHPLTTVKTLLYLLRHDSISTRDEHLEVIEGRVSVLHSLLEELTEYHRIEAGRGYITVEKVAVLELLTECVANFSPALVGGEVQIQCTVSPELDLISTDRNKLLHILLNLLSNALKFTPQGQITVRADSVGGDHWVLAVEDTGLGIHKDVQAHIFEEFYQDADNALSQRRQGFGLGLSIVKQLCDALQGKLELVSLPGQGTRFAVTFPQNLIPSAVTFS